jgi:sulfide:quinone oxidoreductase
VIAGGGVAALETALALRALAADRVEMTLLAAESQFWYRPLSVLEPFEGGRVRPLDLFDLAADCGAALELGTLASVDASRRVVHTADGAAHDYDALVVACGARQRDALPGAFTFRGPGDGAAVAGLLDELGSTPSARLVFAVPGETTWPLPLYELALLATVYASKHGSGIETAFVTPEAAPLDVFGAEASAMVAGLLQERGVELHAGRTPLSLDDRVLRLSPSGALPADRVVALPRLEGRMIPGLPYDADGFIPTDEHGRVIGAAGVFAAGDGTAFPIKQGGLATQQADAVADAIAAEAGAPVTPTAFRPLLRGLLLTGGTPEYMRAEIADGAATTTGISTEALWWPPGKIVGRYLAPFLATRAGLVLSEPPSSREAIAIEVPL